MTSTSEARERFIALVAAAVPRLDPATAADARISSDALNHLQRVALSRSVSRVFRSVDVSVWESATTLSEVFELASAQATPDFSYEKPDREDFGGAGVRLRPVLEQDEALLHEAAMEPRRSYRWRWRGRTISPSEFSAALHDGVLAQFMVEDVESGAPQGFVVAYQYDAAAKHCYFGFQRAGEGRSGAMAQGLLFFLNYLFSRFDLAKVYAEVPEYNRVLFDGASLAVLEAEQREHFFFDAEYHSLLTYAIYREAYLELSSSWVS